MLSGEAANTYFIVFGLIWSGLEPTIYRTWGGHANNYTTDAGLEAMKYIVYLYFDIYAVKSSNTFHGI